MPGAIESSTALHLYLAEPSMTALSSRYAQRRERLVEVEEVGAGGTFSIRRIVERTSATQDGETLTPTAEISANVIVPRPAEDTTAGGTAILTENPPNASDQLIAQLLRFEKLDADWDGNDAAKPLLGSLRDARDFVRALAPESTIPRPTLHADGTAVLLLLGSDIYAELEFLGSKKIGYFARRGDEEWNDDFSFDGGSLPDALCRIGFVLER